MRISGSRTWAIRALSPRRSRPALARRMASYSPLSNLRLTAQAAGAEPRPFAQRCKSLAVLCNHEAIANIVAAANHGKTEARRHVGRHIFDAVDRKVDLFAKERVFQFFDENALAANFCKTCVWQFVAGRLDDDNFGVDPRGLEDLFADKFRLP